MSSKAMSLKGRINNYAKVNHMAAQVVLQNLMFERLLARLSDSVYRDKFVVKGGMLVAAIVGLDTRATMDLDTTLRDLPLTEDKIRKAFEEIIAIDKEDEVIFLLKSIEPIRKDDVYGGYRVRIDAKYDTILTPLSVDHLVLYFMNSKESSTIMFRFPCGDTTLKRFLLKSWKQSFAEVFSRLVQEISMMCIFLEPHKR